MNQQEKIAAIFELFEPFLVHDKLYEELIDVMARSGQFKQIYNLLTKALNQLRELGNKTTEIPSFEVLTGTDGIYSMHLRNKSLNLRILYSYSNSGEILLHCFHEKDDSRKSSYDAHIPIAEQRKKEMERRLL